MEKELKQYKCVGTKEEVGKIKLLTSKLKTFSGERVSQVLVRVLEENERKGSGANAR